MAEDIKQRLHLGEDVRTEFKSVARSSLDLKDLARELVAFANGRGGQIFIGVEDDGTPTGVGTVQDADALMRQVVQTCQNRVQPAIYCPVSKVEVTGRLLLVIDVPAYSPDRPYQTDGRYFVRDASMARPATRDDLLRLLQSQHIHYDETAIEGASKDDLEPEVIDRFLRDAYGAAAVARRQHYLQALQCMDPGGTPTVAGVLLFSREPQRWLMDARISAVCFPGRRISGTMADKREIDGNLFQQLDAAMAFVERNLPAPARIDGWQRVEQGIPEQAIREAVLNALAHRDYRAASQIRIFMYEDRIEVINPGVLLNQLTLDSIRLGGISQRRNPVLAAVLSRAGRRENLGMGVPEMIGLMVERGLPEPEIRLEGGHFRVVLRAAPPEEERA